MTTTTETERDLLAAIVAAPDDDTPRLAYADALDEREPVRVACPECKGRGKVDPPCDTCDGNGRVADPDSKYSDGTMDCPDCDTETCPRCDGTGSVLDTGNADRAELIRAQVRAAAIFASLPSLPDPWTQDDQIRHDIAECCNQRANDLLAANPKWSRLECPACEEHTTRDGCPCGGSHDLFMPFGDGARRRTLTFARGFLDSVTCTLAEAFAPDGTPTPWARAVAGAVPTLTRLVISDREPTQNARSLAFMWVRDSGWPADLRDELPSAVFDALPLRTDSPYHVFGNPGDWRSYPTRAAAIDALAVACCRAARGAGCPGGA